MLFEDQQSICQGTGRGMIYGERNQRLARGVVCRLLLQGERIWLSKTVSSCSVGKDIFQDQEPSCVIRSIFNVFFQHVHAVILRGESTGDGSTLFCRLFRDNFRCFGC